MFDPDISFAFSDEFGLTAKPNNVRRIRPTCQVSACMQKREMGTVEIPIAEWPKGSKQAIASV